MTGRKAGEADCPVPSHAYVPGQTHRHPEGAFAAICETARPDCDVEALARSKAWCCGLEWLGKGYFWEAHEVFEPVWMSLPQKSPERQLVQALIQLANAGLKAEMGRPKATAKLLNMAGEHLRACRSGGGKALMGLRLDMAERWIEERRAQL